MQYRAEPLDADIWLAQAVTLRTDLQKLDHGSATDRLLRRYYHLSQLLPDPVWDFFSSPLGEGDFENLIETCGDDVAVVRSFNPKLTAVVTKSPDRFLVEINCRYLGAAGKQKGQILALTLLAAWFDCLERVLDHALQQVTFRPSQHISQPEPHQPWTWH